MSRRHVSLAPYLANQTKGYASSLWTDFARRVDASRIAKAVTVIEGELGRLSASVAMLKAIPDHAPGELVVAALDEVQERAEVMASFVEDECDDVWHEVGGRNLSGAHIRKWAADVADSAEAAERELAKTDYPFDADGEPGRLTGVFGCAPGEKGT